MKKSFLTACTYLYMTMIHAQSPVFNSVTTNAATINKYAKFELTIDLTAAYSNPYNYDDINVQCIFISPGGRRDTVDGFYMENYSLNTTTGGLTDLGTHNFKVRYSPNKTGTWSYILSAKNINGTTTRNAANFQCTASSLHGFIKKNTSNYLGFDDSTQYIPVGEDMGWQDNNIFLDYNNWLGKLSANGGNFIRVWMSDWAFALEWKNGYNGYSGLENYKQTSAYYLDWLLEKCSDLDVYMMLCLNHHGQVSTGVNPEWSNNPYNSANGGPCANTWDFFTNTSAKNYYKNRQRYIIARYGYSKNIQSWELFNEVDWTDDFANKQTDVTSWHNEMATFIKSKDVYKHLVTTSYAYDTYDPDTWQLSNIDFTQTHYYVNAPNIETVIANGTEKYLSAYKKPNINGEFGLGVFGADLIALDSGGVHIHNTIWGSALSGAMGCANTWSWDEYIDAQNLYYHYKPLLKFLSGIELQKNNYKKIETSISGGSTSDLVISPGESFVKASASDFTIDANANMTPDAGNLSAFLFGNTWNTQYRNPPTFHVNYPVKGKFQVITGSSIGTDPTIVIYVDGVQKLNQSGAINTTYTVTIPAGAHDIKVDNLGTDWITISNYTFAKIAPAIENFVLRSASKTKVAGWLLNKDYNWQYLHNKGRKPLAVTGASINIPGIKNGNYTVNFYNCSTGKITGSTNVTAINSTLAITLPSVRWDIAFTAEMQSSGVNAVKNDQANEYKKINIHFYPNPVTNYVMMQGDIGKYSIFVTDIQGKQILNKIVSMNGSDEKILLPKINAGTYFISVQDERGNIIQKQKIIKQ